VRARPRARVLCLHDVCGSATVRVMGYDEDMYKPQDKEGVSGFAVPSTMWCVHSSLQPTRTFFFLA